jgi:hypothetical protein
MDNCSSLRETMDPAELLSTKPSTRYYNTMLAIPFMDNCSSLRETMDPAELLSSEKIPLSACQSKISTVQGPLGGNPAI